MRKENLILILAFLYGLGILAWATIAMSKEGIL